MGLGLHRHTAGWSVYTGFAERPAGVERRWRAAARQRGARVGPGSLLVWLDRRQLPPLAAKCVTGAAADTGGGGGVQIDTGGGSAGTVCVPCLRSPI